MKNIGIIFCFIWPFVCSCLQIQNVVELFLSDTYAQLIAYSNLILVLLGVFLIRKDIGELSISAKIWFIFYAFYYSFGLLAAGIHGFDSPILRTFIPVIYFIGFYFFMSNMAYRKIFIKAITISFIFYSIITIILYNIDFDFKVGKFLDWPVVRANGLTDANGSALIIILAYIFFNYYYRPSKIIFKILKSIVILILFYSLFITYSTTGLTTFVIIFLINNHKFFRGIRLVISGVLFMIFYGSLFFVENITKGLNLLDSQIYKLNNLINVLTFNTEKIDNSGRGDLLENLLMYISKNPIIGNGVDFSVEMQGHNTYFGVWADAGIFTFILLLIILIIYIFKSFPLKLELRFFCLSIIFALCIFMFSLQSIINQPHYMALFVFIGYVIDNQKLDKQEILVNYS